MGDLDDLHTEVSVFGEGAGDVEQAMEVAEEYMDEEDPTEGQVIAHICRCYIGSE